MEKDLKNKLQKEYKKQNDLLLQKAKEEIKKIKTEADKKKNQMRCLKKSLKKKIKKKKI